MPTVRCDSGANHNSCHEVEVAYVDLGFESKEEWDRASEEDKFLAVQEYFNSNGYPEFSWSD